MRKAGEQELSIRRLVVAEKTEIAAGIFRFELRDRRRRELPIFTPGAHISVCTPGGMNRNYSLCNAPSERERYVVAVKRDPSGRGGSVSMADELQLGDSIEVSAPRNEFELSPAARNFIFVAGGIGITPILSMMRHLKATGATRFKLYYCTRSPELTAFRQELADVGWSSEVMIHHDFGDREKFFDFWPSCDRSTKGCHCYCCGPRALI